jgi:hypothetical protein
MSSNTIKHADSFKTRTGKTRLGPLTVSKLSDMLKTARKKDLSKIQNRINFLVNKKGFRLPDTETAE